MARCFAPDDFELGAGHAQMPSQKSKDFGIRFSPGGRGLHPDLVFPLARLFHSRLRGSCLNSDGKV